MYYQLKNLLTKALPQKWIDRNELQLRKLYVTLFVPKGHCKCPICEQELKEFISIDKGELLCPSCGSGKRHRRLFQKLKNEINPGSGLLLDFSPNKGFEFYARKHWKDDYKTSDFDQTAHTDFHFDIQNIDSTSDTFSNFICYHVLEHIPDDRKAMAELYRILRPGGTGYIQTPFKKGNIYEAPAITLPEERLKHFGQEDHVRIYSVDGMAKRLQDAGFEVNILHFNKEEQPTETHTFGLKDEEFILVVKKTQW